MHTVPAANVGVGYTPVEYKVVSTAKQLIIPGLLRIRNVRIEVSWVPTKEGMKEGKSDIALGSALKLKVLKVFPKFSNICRPVRRAPPAPLGREGHPEADPQAGGAPHRHHTEQRPHARAVLLRNWWGQGTVLLSQTGQPYTCFHCHNIRNGPSISSPLASSFSPSFRLLH